ncbi:MAG: DNA mismatch repair protein MutL [Flavobacteriaceae bacterium]|nr:DNA mismatch repair protein MutL [Flavobacteriaceae bacterium]
MSSIIKLLPQNVANQIAAGEVVQRPSSVVKELLENSIDAKANNIRLIIKDSGKTLIQVVDDGIGMSNKDIKLCFLRHATSKIKQSKDLFDLKFMGFRGEALSSIASVSQMTIISNNDDQTEIGNKIKINAGQLVLEEEQALKKGTSISVENLFFNIPARRNFLKSDSVELRHIIDEFHRISLINHNINFILINNGNEIFNLKKSIFKERIIRIFGKSSLEKLVPIDEVTDFVNINGFIYKPDFARKTKTAQFFFVNNRFIKNHHLNHAVKSAYEGLIDDKYFPSYFLNFEVPNNTIDVNIHPNKTEIRFDNAQSIYAVLKSSVKHSLGQFNISPTIDFENGIKYHTPYDYKNKTPDFPKISVDRLYNPFETEKMIDIKIDDLDTGDSVSKINFPDKSISFPSFQIDGKYVISKNSSGLVIINQQRAHQRILYEKFLKEFCGESKLSQALIFPIKLDLSKKEINVVLGFKTNLIAIGFEFSKFTKSEIELSAFNPIFNKESIEEFFREIIMDHENDINKVSASFDDYMARVFSKSHSSKSKKSLILQEQHSLINDLFACNEPSVSPFNQKIFKVIPLKSIENKILK